MFNFRKPSEMPTPAQALPGRNEPIPTASAHVILGTALKPPYPAEMETAIFGLGCFWGAERKFWQLGPGIFTTAAGYAGGHTPNPTYDEVCSGRTGHTEAVRVVFDPAQISYARLLATFWESHDPTQGYRQGNDTGTQYRSAIYTTTGDQLTAAEAARALFQQNLTAAGFGAITTEIRLAPAFYYAEAGHQQYLAKVPHGYCGLGGTGVSCPLPAGIVA